MPTYFAEVTVAQPEAQAITVKRLVEAPKESAALRHVADDTISIRLATSKDIHECGKLGIEIETVTP